MTFSKMIALSVLVVCLLVNLYFIITRGLNIALGIASMFSLLGILYIVQGLLENRRRR